jgi:hypothetical protein
VAVAPGSDLSIRDVCRSGIWYDAAEDLDLQTLIEGKSERERFDRQQELEAD